MDPRGQNSGQPSWGAYIDALVAEHGSLTSVGERLASARGHAENVESILRALRRLRTRGTLPGGQWGTRLLRTFGLPAAVDARLRFMGSYHSRFVDLPVSLCTDLVQLWDRPPTSESRPGRLWLSLARVILALRTRQPDEARVHLAAARGAGGEVAGLVEIALAEAWLEARASPAVVPAALLPVEGLLAQLSGDDADCLRARWAGQVAHAWNRAERFAEAQALHVALPDTPTTHPFARARRANGLAYARWRLGDPHTALELARASARHAGDAGHVRLRAMALLMIARIAPGTSEGEDARARAMGIARALEDTTLAARAEGHRPAEMATPTGVEPVLPG